METGEREGERTHSLFCKLDKRVSAGFTTGRTSFVKEEVEGRDGPELGEERQERVLVHRRVQVADIQPVFEEGLLRRCLCGGIAVGGRAGVVVLVGEGEEGGRGGGGWWRRGGHRGTSHETSARNQFRTQSRSIVFLALSLTSRLLRMSLICILLFVRHAFLSSQSSFVIMYTVTKETRCIINPPSFGHSIHNAPT
jgi:hypothetical protein